MEKINYITNLKPGTLCKVSNFFIILKIKNYDDNLKRDNLIECECYSGYKNNITFIPYNWLKKIK